MTSSITPGMLRNLQRSKVEMLNCVIIADWCYRAADRLQPRASQRCRRRLPQSDDRRATVGCR
jgi:hypothetical protein